MHTDRGNKRATILVNKDVYITNNIDIVKYSQDQFGFKLPSELIPSQIQVPSRTAIF